MFTAGFAEIVPVVADEARSARFYQEVVGLTPEPPVEDTAAKETV